MMRWPAATLVLLAVIATALVLARSDDPVEAPPAPEPHGECVLSGVVLDRENLPVSEIDVRARILDPGLAFGTGSTISDPDGRFELRLFPARGRWEVTGARPDGAVFTATTPVEARKGGRPEVTLRQTSTAEPPNRDLPNLGGEVVDGQGRLLTGIPVIAVRRDGTIASRGTSGPGGRFAMFVTDPPPLSVQIAPESGRSAAYHKERRVVVLPRLDLVLLVDAPAPDPDALYVRVDLCEWPGDQEVRVILLNSLGEVERDVRRRLAEAPWRLERIPRGPYDVVVQGQVVSGMLQGFDFTPGNNLAVVPVGGSAGIAAQLSRPARVFLLSLSPTLVPLSVENLDEDGIHGTVRGTWTRSRGEDSVERVDFASLPPGLYLLRVLGRGLETVERRILLPPGRQVDLGTIEVAKATGSASIRVFDGGEPSLGHGYQIRLYDGAGTILRSDLEPGSDGEAVFEALSAGTWKCRVDRKLDEAGRLRSVGRDAPIEIRRGERSELLVDCTW